MRRGVTISVAAMLMLSMAVPAGAKKPNRPTEYVVTMSFEDGGAGLATTCGEQPGDGEYVPVPGENAPIVMSGSLNNVLSAYGNVLTGGELWLELVAPVAWSRSFDAGWGASGPSFSGCHGQSESAAETGSFPGALWLTFGKDTSGDDTVEFLWRFDYYWQFGPVKRGNKFVEGQQALEIFELRSEEMVLGEDGTVSGPFTVTLFTKTVAEGVTHFWDWVGTNELSFNLSITPR